MSALHVLAFALLAMMVVIVMMLANAYADDLPELRKLRLFAGLLVLLAVVGLTGCATAPNVPKQVIVTVEKFKPLPAWATDPLAKPEATDGSVGARVRSEAERGITIDLANCHRRLLKKLDAGETVDPKECAQP
jgi:hypothetical protein